MRVYLSVSVVYNGGETYNISCVLTQVRFLCLHSFFPSLHRFLKITVHSLHNYVAGNPSTDMNLRNDANYHHAATLSFFPCVCVFGVALI